MKNMLRGFEAKNIIDFEVKEVKEMWSTFVDIKIRFKDLNHMTAFCFDYMPSSVDIIEPVKFNFDAHDINALFNDLMGEIHHYDMLLKNFKALNEMLKRKVKG